jgi:ferrous iron transport protein B
VTETTTTARVVTVALAGQPNVGKSTIFNRLTGLSQHVGNWPGKTVEQKVGELSYADTAIRLVDLPGTYGLTANSEEERIARDYILRERPDVVVAIVNAASLERNLYLVAELLSLPTPLVIGLNMMDVAASHGVRVEPDVLQAALRVVVVPLVAARNQGLTDLIEAAVHVASKPASFAPTRPEIRPAHGPILEAVAARLRGALPPLYPVEWAALKLLEGDVEIAALVREQNPAAWGDIHALLAQHEDAYLDIAGGRYEWISRMVRAAVVRPRAGAVTVTDRIDRVATHPFWGLGMLGAVLTAVFWLTYTLAAPLVSLLGRAIESLGDAAHGALAAAPPWVSGFVADGVIGGAGMVFSFLPILVFFFALMGLLEDVGYLARMAYVMDRFMHRLGLHGKSSLPLFLGFGCNIPAVLGTRIIEDRRARLLTLLLAPLVPCTARLAVVTFLAPAFFGQRATWVMVGLVALNLAVVVGLGVALNRFAFRGAKTAFIMEMPLYHPPNPRTIALFVWHSLTAFLKKASTVIVVVSAVVWVLSQWPGPGMQHSALAMVGRAFAPIGAWFGLGDWRFIAALLTSFVAKENTIATLGVLFATGAGGPGLAHQVAAVLPPSAALAFLVVQMLFVPCVATVAVTRQEAGWRWALASVGLLLVLSLGIGTVVFQVASRV